MKGWTAKLGLLIVLLLTVVALSSVEGASDRHASCMRRRCGNPDIAMLDQMRASSSPVMMSMIKEDSMWTDPDMTRTQEEIGPNSIRCWESDGHGHDERSWR